MVLNINNDLLNSKLNRPGYRKMADAEPDPIKERGEGGGGWVSHIILIFA